MMWFQNLYSVVFVVSMVASVSGHGAVTIPKPRQAIDGGVHPWNGTVPGPMPFMFWCASPTEDAFGVDERNVTGNNGQACFWFNNGCDISCDKCDGMSGQMVQPRYVYTGAGEPPSWSGEGIMHDPAQSIEMVYNKRPDGSHRPSICKNPIRNATICDPKLRTINVDAPCGSELDFFYYSPWRAPGAAPVIDSCGTAGGVYPGSKAAAAGGDYQTTVNAHRGMLGKDLPPLPTNTVWTAGDVVEVAWTHKAFHGGGYQYRLCPAGKKLDEECFQAAPIPFADETSMLRWGGKGGKKKLFDAVDVSVGTIPVNSTWRKGPITRGPWGWYNGGSFNEPVCDEPEACFNQKKPPHGIPGHSDEEGAYPCTCSGWGVGDLYTLEIVDMLRIPKDTPPGEYVVGWRWDCEQSTQVWSSCSDVTIKV